MRKFKTLMLLLMVCINCMATDYFVSAGGSNSNSGLDASHSWQTLAKVATMSNAGSIHAGDRILLNCGDQFIGGAEIQSIFGGHALSGTLANPITITSYGSGAKPLMLYPTGGALTPENRIFLKLVGVNYWIIDGLNFSDLNSSNDHVAGANLGVPIYLGSFGDATTNNCTVKNCDVTLCGMGVVVIGDNNTITNCNMSNFKNLKSTPNVGGNTAFEDYGANPFTLIWANNTTITNNIVSGGWAESMDFGYNGGFCEIIGQCSNNKIMYNSIVDCNGLSEYGQGGNSANNLYAYNILIDCGAMFWINSDCQATNIQYFNNTNVETNNSRFAQGSANAGAGVVSAEALSHLNVDQNSFDYSGSSQTAGTVFNLKNNIFNISNPLKICRSSQTKLAHDYNIFKLSGGSNFSIGLNTHDLSTSATLFTNTTDGNAANWDLTLSDNSPAIDAGVSVSLFVDYLGAAIVGAPDIGALEKNSVVIVTPGPHTFILSNPAFKYYILLLHQP